MDQAGAFLESILETPDDDTPRLIFADWLEENDQPDRAEFIRLQIARTKLHPAHPQVRASLLREGELLAQHERLWLGPLAVFALKPRFQRGFVEEVTLSAEQFLGYGEEALNRAPIRRVQIRGTSALPHLIESNLDLQRRLANLLRRIRVLDLNRDGLNEAAGSMLLMLPKLPELEGLHLAFNALTPAGVDVLAVSDVLESLTTLEFNSSSREAIDLLLHSPKLRKLEHLYLAGSVQGDRIVSSLHDPQVYLPHLRTLSLGHTNLSPDGVRELVQSPLASRLESLDVSFNPLGAEGVQHITRSAQMRRLTTLNLSRTRVGYDGDDITRRLADSPLFSRLASLDLSLNRITDKGAHALADYRLSAFPLTLDLIYNPLNTNARKALVNRYGKEVCLFTR